MAVGPSIMAHAAIQTEREGRKRGGRTERSVRYSVAIEGSYLGERGRLGTIQGSR